ncbi:HD family phosphohydrolase [Alkalihalobacillus sp. AL-G]|uniref:HD family phosphohydrolase n=1 Tax=Alkalihalobacillus sp. AL-G TaxID=2926399 RepID=UPI00272D7DA2|nr:HD family phosphohydrolase [Alkalihalobacillus sp. AL-G]WLD92122.1 HD family phosphohydrolase [Alkalihalobacillus sp. AL-G]
MSLTYWQMLKKKWNAIENSKISRFLLYICLAVAMIATMLSNVIPNQLDVQLYTFAEEDIQSPIEIVNEKETKEKKVKAAEAIEDEYRVNDNKALNQIITVEDMFATIEELQAEEEKHSQTETETNLETTESDDPTTENIEKTPSKTIDEKIVFVRKSIPDFIDNEISDQTIQTLIEATESERSFSMEVAMSAIKNVMSQHIKVSQIEEKKKEVEPLITSSSLPADLKIALIDLSSSAITSNYIFDAEATKKLQEEAANNVEPVYIREGQIIVKKGQFINKDVLYQLELVGLLDDDFSPYPYLGLGSLVLLMTAFLIYFLRELNGEEDRENTDLIIYVLLFSLTLVLMKITSLLGGYYPGIMFIVPVALGTMMIKMLINEQTAIISSIVFAICGSLLFNESTTSPFNFTFGTYILVSSLAGVVFLGKRNVKGKILKTGISVALVNAIIVFAILALSNGQYNLWNVSSQVAFAMLSGFLAAVLTLGLLPFFEAGFGILTSMKLIELSNPNHPLLRKLLMETPGTYHHSVVVANLSEAGCEAVGANGLLARVGSYYHDLGKTKRPHFFIENQMNMENPHDKISPQLSKTIIIAHPYDGAEMLKEYHLPKEIIEIAEQHHGTTLLKYFYHRALQQSDKNIEESDFRYPGPKAQTRESAIVGIADAVEAAVRSMSKPTPVKIESLVRKIIAERLKDGQFNECSITLMELETVAKTICETLQGMFHQRIEYPEEIQKKKVSQA